jgi:hypothetical protein
MKVKEKQISYPIGIEVVVARLRARALEGNGSTSGRGLFTSNNFISDKLTSPSPEPHGEAQQLFLCFLDCIVLKLAIWGFLGECVKGIYIHISLPRGRINPTDQLIISIGGLLWGD